VIDILVVVAVPILGVGRFLAVASLVVNSVFIAYFCRPASCAISAARWSRVDLVVDPVDLVVDPVDLDDAPPLTVLVACRNEEAAAVPLVAAPSRLEHDRRCMSGPPTAGPTARSGPACFRPSAGGTSTRSPRTPA
jgi:hypothetical protein